MPSFLLSHRQGNLLGSLSAHSSLVSGSSNDTTARGDGEGDAVGERRTFPMVWFSESVVVLAILQSRRPPPATLQDGQAGDGHQADDAQPGEQVTDRGIN